MIEIRDLDYVISGKTILKNVNLTINPGGFTSIIGPNGGGKSTLLKIIIGLYKGYGGSIRISGEDHHKWIKKNIFGYVPQKEMIDRNFPATVKDIVLMGLAAKRGILRRFNREDKLLADRAMELVGIKHLKDENAGYLSGGEFQRALLARAISSNSDYIFLDEPESSIDKQGVHSLYELLADLNQRGKTILVISHDVNTTTKYSDSIVCLNKTLHCHKEPELISAEIIKNTYGNAIQLIERN